MKPHEQRVVDEAQELAQKIQKLDGFFDTEIFRDAHPVTRHLLKKQFNVMNEYWDLLMLRVSMFEVS